MFFNLDFRNRVPNPGTGDPKLLEENRQFLADTRESEDLSKELSQIEGISGLDQDAKDSIKRQVAEQFFQKGPDLDTFQTMLNKLTGSKMKQQGQAASARRGDIYAGGLANMMSNF